MRTTFRRDQKPGERVTRGYCVILLIILLLQPETGSTESRMLIVQSHQMDLLRGNAPTFPRIIKTTFMPLALFLAF